MSKKRTREDEEGEAECVTTVEGNSVEKEEERRRKKSPKLSTEQSDKAEDGHKQEKAVSNTEKQQEKKEGVKEDEEGKAAEEEPVQKEEEEEEEDKNADVKKDEAEVEIEKKVEGDKEEKTEEGKKKEQNDTEKENVEEKKESKSAIGGGHVFGSGSTFGSAFGSIPQKNVFASDDKENKDTKKEESVTKKPVFGSGFTFGSGSFTNEKKENIFDSAPKEEAKKEEEDTNQDTPEASKETYAKVEQPLQEKKIETGEEGEESVFSCRAKLYTLDLTNPSEGWRERGVGTLHVNTTQESKSRLVMRADGVLKVILNLPLLSGFEVLSGMKSSLSGEKFVRINCIQDNKPLQYALRTSNADISKQLFEKIENLIPSE